MVQTLVRSGATGTGPAAVPFWSLPEGEGGRFAEAHADDRAVGARGARSAGSGRTLAWLRVVAHQFLSPITLILVVAALIAASTGDLIDGSIIVGIVVCSALLGAWQEGRAADAVAALLVEVAVTVEVTRRGQALR